VFVEGKPEPEPEPEPEATAAAPPTKPWAMSFAQREQAKMPLRILCIDGGGSKGLIPAIVLQHLEEFCAPHKICELFDLVCGTSTGVCVWVECMTYVTCSDSTFACHAISGGIICLGTCLAKAPIQEIIDVYEHHAAEIWTPKSHLMKHIAGNSPLKLACRDPTQYKHGPLEKILKEKCIDRAYMRPRGGTPDDGDSPPRRQLRMDGNQSGQGPKVFVVAAHEEQGVTTGPPRKMHLFRSYGLAHERNAGSSDCEVWEAARATSAAPLYFDRISICDKAGNTRDYCDGGVCENNPVRVARKEVQDIWPNRPVGLILSLGCGLASKDNSDLLGATGEIKKAFSQLTDPEDRHIEALQDMSISYDKGAKLPDSAYIYGGDCKHARDPVFRGARYVRLNPLLRHSIQMDTCDPMKLAMLRTTAEKFLSFPSTTAQMTQVRKRLGYPF
jgi:hypothetical protein